MSWTERTKPSTTFTDRTKPSVTYLWSSGYLPWSASNYPWLKIEGFAQRIKPTTSYTERTKP